jgi:hypothetical protein
MKKLIEIVRQFFGLGATAKAITTATQLNAEIKEAVIEVEQKVEEVKKKVTRKKSAPKTETNEKPKRGRKPKQQ